MSSHNELDRFRAVWNAEAERTIGILEALPDDHYDFRPDPGGRSIGEMAWHLCEIEACLTYGLEVGRFAFEDEPPNLARPRETRLLAPGFRRIHEEAVARLDALEPARIDETITYFDGQKMTVRAMLWEALLHHLIHHRAQLVLLCRQAGGSPPGLYGPNREEMQAMISKAKSPKQ